jgi:hypothetical protein
MNLERFEDLKDCVNGKYLVYVALRSTTDSTEQKYEIQGFFE